MNNDIIRGRIFYEMLSEMLRDFENPYLNITELRETFHSNV